MSHPPSFPEARNRRQKVRSAGMHPDYWYAVEYVDAVPAGKVVEARFWGKSFAIYRGEDGRLAAMENRCAHRLVKLSRGEVNGCRLTCPYHGWSYDADGALVDVAHETFGRRLPNVSIPTYPVRERYGLIWLFPGDPAKAESTPMPEIPELEGPDAWACVPLDYTLDAHFSMIVENTCDFTHEYLHKRWQPFANPTLRGHEVVGDRIFVSYDTKVAAGGVYDLFIARSESPAMSMKLAYDYPHQWSNTDERYKHWMFVLPIDERTTRVFFLFYYRSLKVPFLPLTIPQRAMKPLLKVANRLLMRPLLDEDAWAVQAEQEGYEMYYEVPYTELSPVMKDFQALTIRKWEEYLAVKDEQPKIRRLPVVARAS